jgi:hypothetical protein
VASQTKAGHKVSGIQAALINNIMRAKEFILEQHRDVSGEHYFPLPMPTAAIVPDASQNFYHMYRFGVAMSKAPDANVNMDDHTKIADKLAILPYTEEEMDIVNRAAKTIGATAKFISNKGTKEEEGGNATSPVAKYVPTKRSS